MEAISRNFSWDEFEHSDTAISMGMGNTIPEEFKPNIVALVENVLQPVRNGWQRAMHISSGFRSRELNRIVGGVETSQHCRGEAADILTDRPYDFANYVRSVGVPFDQMGISNNFVHLSHRREGMNRGMIFYYKEYKGTRL